MALYYPQQEFEGPDNPMAKNQEYTKYIAEERSFYDYYTDGPALTAALGSTQTASMSSIKTEMEADALLDGPDSRLKSEIIAFSDTNGLTAIEDSGSILDTFALFEVLESYSKGDELCGFSCLLCSSEYSFHFNPPFNPAIVEARCSCGYRIYMQEGDCWRQCIMQCFNTNVAGTVGLPSPPNITCATCSRKLTTIRFLDKARARVIMSCSCGSRNYDREGQWWIRRGNTKQRKAPQVQCSDCGRRMWVHTWFDDFGTKVKMLCKCGYRNYSKQGNTWVRSPRWKRPVPHVVCGDCSKKMYMSQWLNSEGTKVKMKCKCGCKTLVSKDGIWVRSDWSQRLSDMKLEKEPLKAMRKLHVFQNEAGIRGVEPIAPTVETAYSQLIEGNSAGTSPAYPQYRSVMEVVKELFTGSHSLVEVLNYLAGLSSTAWFSDETSRCKADKISLSARKLSDTIKNSSPANAKKAHDILTKLAKGVSVQNVYSSY